MKRIKFDLKTMLIAIAILAMFLAALAGRMQGIVILICFLCGVFILLAPSPATLPARVSVILVGIGAALLGWCILAGLFGRNQQIGNGWYRGQLDEVGGWATGLLVAAWRASYLFDKRS